MDNPTIISPLKSLRKINLNFLIIVGIDMLYYTLLSFVLSIIASKIMLVQNSIQLPSDLEAQPAEIIKQAGETASDFYMLLIFSIIAFCFIFILFSSIAKGIIWGLTSKTKITLDYMVKFLAMNSIIILSFFLISVIIFAIMNFNAAPKMVIAISIPFIFIGTIAYALFQHYKSANCIRKAINLAAQKSRIVIYYFAVLTGAFALILITNSLLHLLNAGQNLSAYIASIIIMSYIAASRYYVLDVVKELSGK